MNYESAERLKEAVEKLEGFVQQQGVQASENVAASADSEKVVALRAENAQLKTRQNEVAKRLDKLIITVGKQVEESTANES